MSFDPPPSLVRIFSEGIIGKDAQHVNVFRVVYGHEKWETVSMCYFYNNKKKNKTDQIHGILLMAQRQGKYNWSLLYTQAPPL